LVCLIFIFGLIFFCVFCRFSVFFCVFFFFFFFFFLWAKGPNARDIYKEMFPVYGGK
jgi:hypothetical protein